MNPVYVERVGDIMTLIPIKYEAGVRYFDNPEKLEKIMEQGKPTARTDSEQER